MKKPETDINAFKLILPKEIFDYFEVVELKESDEQVDISLDEKDIAPVDYKREELESKGFHQSVGIQDFPLRRRKVLLHIRRRKWQVKSNGKIISRDWDLVSKGTHLTQEFAIFLKGILG
jgi:hypothetical protein